MKYIRFSDSFSFHTKIRLLIFKTSHLKLIFLSLFIQFIQFNSIFFLYLKLNTNGSVFSINGFPHVVQAGSSEDNSSWPSKACEGKKQKEKPIQHHCNVLPVLHYLIVLVIVPDMLSNELYPSQGHLHFWTELVWWDRVL